MMLIGEQPGDYEDLAVKPFVGAAGKIMDRALEQAGIDRSQVYVTNAVKHFKWEPRGKRRIYQKPNSREIAACRPWLEAELRLVRPKPVVAMGATAAQGIFGPAFRVTRERGKVLSSKLAPRVLATVHPSSRLRQPDEEPREREYKHCAPHHAPLTKDKPGSFDDRCVSGLVFCYERLAELTERPAFNFHARSTHQIQIKMQIVQRDQAKPENFFCLNEVTNVAARKITAGITPAVVF
jgi:DNA polymerase